MESLGSKPVPENRLEEFRVAAGLTKSALARKAGTSTDPIYAAEDRKRILRKETQASLSNALNKSPAVVFPNG
jgi:DNA-binding XRE family transcriptional regulator